MVSQIVYIAARDLLRSSVELVIIFCSPVIASRMIVYTWRTWGPERKK
jgi:hypothetical protein